MLRRISQLVHWSGSFLRRRALERIEDFLVMYVACDESASSGGDPSSPEPWTGLETG